MASPQFDNFLQAMLAQRTDAGPSLDELRAAGDILAQMLPPSADVEIEPTDAGGVPAEWVRAPGSSPDRVVLHLHGGGYCIWSPRTYRNFNGRLSAATGAQVLSVDYRLAPEHPHPAAVEDAVTAYQSAIDGRPVAVCGDSAGGGLTLALLVALRDRALPMPVCAVPISPWTDLEMTGEVSDDAKSVDILRLEHLKFFADWYLAGSDARAPLAAPLHADLSGLPPLLVLAGEREILLDDARRIVDRAHDAGVEAALHVAPGMIHIWPTFGGLFPEADEGVGVVADFLKRYL
jgi:acetyl esterase/lipase